MGLPVPRRPSPAQNTHSCFIAAPCGHWVQLAPRLQAEPALPGLPQASVSTFIMEVVIPFHRKYLFTYLPSQVEGEPPEAGDHFSRVLESLAPNQAKCLYTAVSQGEQM